MDPGNRESSTGERQGGVQVDTGLGASQSRLDPEEGGVQEEHLQRGNGLSR